MTTTTATAKLRFIPETGQPVTVVVNGTEVTAKWTNGAGWTVMARRDGYTIHANTQPDERIAVDLFNQLVEQYENETAEVTTEVEQPAPVAAPIEMPAPVKLAPAAKGTQTKVSDPGHTVLALADSATDGIVRRGGKPGEATVKQIDALAKRGYLTRILDETGRYGARQYVIGGQITAKGMAKLAELTKAETEAARLAAAIAGTYSYAA